MAFIRKRLSGPQRKSYSYQLLESYRVDGKIRHRVLFNLGPCPTIDAVLEELQERLKSAKENLAWLQESTPSNPFVSSNMYLEMANEDIADTEASIAFLRRVVVSDPRRHESDTTSRFHRPIFMRHCRLWKNAALTVSRICKDGHDGSGAN